MLPLPPPPPPPFIPLPAGAHRPGARLNPPPKEKACSAALPCFASPSHSLSTSPRGCAVEKALQLPMVVGKLGRGSVGEKRSWADEYGARLDTSHRELHRAANGLLHHWKSLTKQGGGGAAAAGPAAGRRPQQRPGPGQAAGGAQRLGSSGRPALAASTSVFDEVKPLQPLQPAQPPQQQAAQQHQQHAGRERKAGSAELPAVAATPQQGQQAGEAPEPEPFLAFESTGKELARRSRAAAVQPAILGAPLGTSHGRLAVLPALPCAVHAHPSTAFTDNSHSPPTPTPRRLAPRRRHPGAAAGAQPRRNAAGRRAGAGAAAVGGPQGAGCARGGACCSPPVTACLITCRGAGRVCYGCHAGVWAPHSRARHCCTPCRAACPRLLPPHRRHRLGRVHAGGARRL
jgi:hypothetical protein